MPQFTEMAVWEIDSVRWTPAQHFPSVLFSVGHSMTAIGTLARNVASSYSDVAAAFPDVGSRAEPPALQQPMLPSPLLPSAAELLM